ncbi:DEAD/DEAH box helicase [Actinomyces sp. zg296]|uniref:DEAD/DEAH box helicase n=1 Tax=Actinomyces sp. zg296 TaxID=2609289 RepID=UPI00135B6D16|nr:AAA domain-containing protein [Actinomyces sp. zg296]
MTPSTPPAHRLRLLDYWWLLELFSPQQVPKRTRPARRGDRRQVIEWRPRQPLPWETLTPEVRRDGTRFVWRHTLYLGVYDLESTYQYLHRAFTNDRDAFDERRGGISACAGVQVDSEGQVVSGSGVLSSSLWAVARLAVHLQRPSSSWGSEFDAAQQGFVAELAERGDAEPGALTSLAHRASGIDAVAELASERVVIESVRVREGGAGDADIDFLNSFFLQDLAAVRQGVATGRCPAALASYLAESGSQVPQAPGGPRIDVMTHDDVVNAGVGADRIPAGRWPSAPHHTLALRQQFAVNRALLDLGPIHGLMGVNGPPGTGKTTMLRDIVAGNVVERARRLAALERADDAFVGQSLRWMSGRHSRVVHALREELTGFEMVVASANNMAVENVSTEIPGAGAIDERWRGRADYFADIASALLAVSAPRGEKDGKEPQDPSAGSGALRRHEDGQGRDAEGARRRCAARPAWGLVAARLGSKRNRAAFVSEFWFDKIDWRTRRRRPGTVPRMQSRLRDWARGGAAHPTWQQACASFRQAEQRVAGLVAVRREAQVCRERLGQLRGEQDRADEEMHRLGGLLAEATEGLRGCEQALNEARAQRDVAARVRDRHVQTRPGLLEMLLTLGRATREWRSALAPLDERLRVAEEAEQGLGQQAARLGWQAEALRRELGDAQDVVERLRREERDLRARLADHRERLGRAYPGPQWAGAQRELRAPWLDAELDEARSELFLAALRLHEDFLANAAGKMLESLRAAMEVVSGEAPSTLPEETVRAAWQSLFLVVPVVSTTFASYGRMFARLGPESLGWLLIDEAGQAAPQYAVGAMWRSKRVVAVGDPLQLEPVVTMPRKAMLDIAAAYGVDPSWIPPRASVQSLTDRVSRCGTTLRQGERPVWVSSPLTVHRRCDEPMFSLCNTMAYDGIMISGVGSRANPGDVFDGPDGPRVLRSQWIDVPANTPGSNAQPSQVDRLRILIADLRRQQVSPKRMIAISPFREMAHELEGLTHEYPGLHGGTIHTAQGREADVVFLVLGGDPNRPGAKAWAAQTVNLVNVAASRAKRRLYVIGDRAAWAQHNYFSQLSTALSEGGDGAVRTPS